MLCPDKDSEEGSDYNRKYVLVGDAVQADQTDPMLK